MSYRKYLMTDDVPPSELYKTVKIDTDSDTISRKAAIDALMDALNDVGVLDAEDINTVFQMLPPAQLGTNLAEVGTDCISRQAAIEALKQQAETMNEWSNRYAEQRKGVLTAVNIVEDLPPAQPERIIHCKDCKHWIPYDWMFSEVWQSKNMADYPEDDIGCAWGDMAMKANDFCSRGERRTE